MLHGELVKLARTLFVLHVGKLWRRVHGVGKSLPADKFRKLDLRQCAGAVGQLHACLEGHVAVARLGHFHCWLAALKPSMVKGLLPARPPDGGMAAWASSPGTRLSTSSETMASSSGSSCNLRS